MAEGFTADSVLLDKKYSQLALRKTRAIKASVKFTPCNVFCTFLSMSKAHHL